MALGSPLGIPAFRSLWLACIVSNLGTMILAVSVAWLMATISSSTLEVALVQSALNLPILLLSLFAGALADRHDRRTIMVVTQLVMTTVAAAFTASIWLDCYNPTILLLFCIAIGCGSAVMWPANQAILGDIVPAALLSEAVALNGMGMNVARSIGPAIGGGMMAVFGASATLATSALAYAFMAGTLLRAWSFHASTERPAGTILASMTAGVRFAAQSGAVYRSNLRSLAFGLFACSLAAFMPLIARDFLHGGPITLGLLLGAFGVGAILASLGSAQLRKRFNDEQLVRLSSLGMALAVLTCAQSRSVALSLAAVVPAGACWLIALATFNINIQLNVPRTVVGRALSFYQTATYGGVTLGSWCLGVIAHGADMQTALRVSAAGLFGVAAMGLALPLQSRPAAAN